MTQKMLTLFQTELSPTAGFMESTQERAEQGGNRGDLGQVLSYKTVYAQKCTKTTQQQKIIQCKNEHRT